MREGRGRGSSALSRSLGGTSRKVLLVLFVSFSASNSVLRLMRCYCFYPCYLSLSLPLSMFLSCSQCVCGIFHVNQNPTKVKQSIRICCNCSTASTVSLVSSHFFHLCSILLPPFLLFFLPFPLAATTYQSTRLVSVENYAIQKFALRVARLFVYFISRSSSLFFFLLLHLLPSLQFCSLSSLAASANSLGPFLCECVCCSEYTCKRVYCICSEC